MNNTLPRIQPWAEPLCAVRSLSSQHDGVWSDRLLFIGHLPADAFREEGIDVATSVAIWDALPTENFETASLGSLDDVPLLSITPPNSYSSSPRLSRIGIESDEPVITRPVTGNNRVRVCHNRRKLLLDFELGFTEARIRAYDNSSWIHVD